MMKKRILTLIVSLLLALNLSACGTKSAAENGTGQNTPSDPTAGSSGQNTPSGIGTENIPGGIGTDNSGMSTPGGAGTDNSDLNTPIDAGTDSSGMDLSGIFGTDDSSVSFSSLTEFYNSQYRTLLEDTLNEIFNGLGLRIHITVEEPDTLIYNYQYISPLSSVGLSHEDAAAAIAANYQDITSFELESVVDSIRTFRSCGLPVRVIRMVYQDTDGSLIYSTDITEDGISSGLPDDSGLPDTPDLPDSPGTTAGVYADLQEWMDSSEDAALTVRSTNQALASTGITFELAVDGNVLVYRYYLPDAFFADGLAEEEQTAVFDSMIDAGSSSVKTVLAVFMDKYGLSVDAIRFVYCSKDGTELYSQDVMP